MSIRSRKIELAVSIPPAPRPIMVCVPECSDVNEIAFNVPLTHKGSTVEFLLERQSILCCMMQST